MRIKRGLVLPKLEQRQLVGIKHALEYLELLTAGFLRDIRAAFPKQLCKLRSLSGRRGDGDNESDCHDASSQAGVIRSSGVTSAALSEHVLSVTALLTMPPHRTL